MEPGEGTPTPSGESSPGWYRRVPPRSSTSSSSSLLPPPAPKPDDDPSEVSPPAPLSFPRFPFGGMGVLETPHSGGPEPSSPRWWLQQPPRTGAPHDRGPARRRPPLHLLHGQVCTDPPRRVKGDPLERVNLPRRKLTRKGPNSAPDGSWSCRRVSVMTSSWVTLGESMGKG